MTTHTLPPMRNPYLGTRQILDAATFLAQYVKDHGRPLRFSAETYLLNVFGRDASPETTEFLCAGAHPLVAAMREDSARRHVEWFVSALDVALALNEVTSVLTCVLAEEGVDEETDHSWFLVMRAPDVEECINITP